MIETRTLSITQLFDDNVEKLKLAWVGAVGVEREVELPDLETYGPDVVGHLLQDAGVQRRAGHLAAPALEFDGLEQALARLVRSGHPHPSRSTRQRLTGSSPLSR